MSNLVTNYKAWKRCLERPSSGTKSRCLLFYFSLNSENNLKYFGFRILNSGKRRTSSDNISTPNSGRSRSPSLLSSEYIPEEEVADAADDDDEEIIRKDSKKRSESKPESGSAPTKMMTSIDALVQLVHDLKEEDLNYHKNLIAKKEAAVRAAQAANLDSPANPTKLDDHVIAERSTGAISKDRDRKKHHQRKSSTKSRHDKEGKVHLRHRHRWSVGRELASKLQIICLRGRGMYIRVDTKFEEVIIWY